MRMLYVIAASTQVHQRRLAHTDVQWPDFTDYRKDQTKDPSARSKDSAEQRKTSSYLVSAGKFLENI